MNPKYQQNLDTINEYIKEQDLIIKVKGFTPAYSTSDEKAILRFMVLASVLEYAKPAFEKFAQHFDTRDSNLESSVRLFTRAIKLDVADLPRVAATTNKSGDLRVELFQASSVAKGVWLFCYGSNGLSQLEERLGRGNFEYHPAVLREGKLVFAGRSSNWSNGGVAAVAPADKDYFVIGGVVKVTKSELLTLDKYEGVARNIYARQQASVITYMDSESNAVTRVKALLYNRVDVINENYVANKPSLQYQHAIIKARKEFWADHPNKLKILNAKLAALVSGASAQNSVSETNTAPSKPAGAVGTTLTLFHGSPYSNVDVSEAPLLYYTANIEVARAYALGTVAFTGKPPKGVHTEHGPTVYTVKAAGLHVFDFRRTDHQELYQHLQEDFNKRLTEDENDSRRPRLWLPPLDSEGFIMHRTGLPSYGYIRVLIPLIKKRHFDAIWIDEGSQGTSIAIFNPRKVQLQDRVQLKRRT